MIRVLIMCVVVGVTMLNTTARAGDGGDHASTAPAAQSLGIVTVDGFEIEVIQTSAVEAGKEATYTLKLKGDKEPKAIRIWIGIESAKGSAKGKAHKHGKKMEAHCDVPDPIPAGAKLWVEVETDAGKTKVSLDYK